MQGKIQENKILETRIFKENENLKEAGEIIRKGGLVAFPTETVYGLGASAFDKAAAKKIYAAKGRPSDNPLIVHICDKAQIEEIARDVSDNARKIIDAFMPGPITVIVNKKSCISDDVTAGLNTVAIRYPDHHIAQALIKEAGVPIAAPSANVSGRPSPTSAEHVIEDMSGKIDAIVDGGICDVGVESTIVDTTGDKCVILRPGGITFKMLKEVIENIEIDKNVLNSLDKDEKPKCPGMKYKHYSPLADVIVVEGEEENVQKRIKELIKENKGKKIGVLVMYGAVYDDAVMLSAGRTNEEYAHNLFFALREFDKLKIDVVFAEFCEKDGYGLAVKNRLYKAAGYNVEHV